MDLANLTSQVITVDGFVWQPFFMPTVLVLVGLLISIRTGLIQIRRFPIAVRTTLQGAFQKKSSKEGTIKPFQALSTALAATVGNGNIGGVATAITVGGPGAIFWMWVCAAVGMATKYAEAVLAVHYRVTRETGELASGPMYYITKGIPNQALGKMLAYAFAFFGMVAALFGTGNMAQSNTIADSFVLAAKSIFNLEVSVWIPSLLITACVGLVLVGGIKRIAAVAEAIVPTMIVVYVTAALYYVVMNFGQLPGVLALIFNSAFSPAAAIGGFVGVGVKQAIATGMSRGVLSNEAGLGSAPIAHGIADVDHPVEQGLVGVFEVFVDTILVCSMTAFIILSSGLWSDPAFQNASGSLTAAAMNTTIPGAALIVATCSFFFGFSTLIGWAYYGEKCFEFLFGSGGIKAYKAVFTMLVLVGGIIPVPLVWAVGTLLNGFMAFPNLIGLMFLVGTVSKLTKQFFATDSV